MNLANFSSAAFTTTGGLAAAANATIEVRRESDGVLATIYSDEAGTVGIANPSAFADASGRFSFYVAASKRGYSVKVTKGAETWTIHTQAIGTAAQDDSTTFGDAVLALPDQSTAVTLITSQKLERAVRRSRLYAAQNLV